jgi:GT2 family glycosyltransferase
MDGRTKENPLVVTVILNTNRRGDTLACLESLAHSTHANHRVIVLDNASTDGSVDAIRQGFPSSQVLRLAANLGYAGNNNVGLRSALDQDAAWVFVLNEDTIVHADCLAELVRVGESDGRIGVVGPLVYHHSEPGVIQSAGGELGARWESRHAGQNEPDTGQFPLPRDVEWVTGCAILVRAAAIRQIGVLDERFFYYWEETEWCLRARREGWRVVHCPSGRLWHKGVSRDYRPGPDVTYYSVRNRLLLMSKHRAPVWRRAAVWAECGRTMLNWTLNPNWRHMHDHRDAMWQGMLDYLRRRWGRRPT